MYNIHNFSAIFLLLFQKVPSLGLRPANQTARERDKLEKSSKISQFRATKSASCFEMTEDFALGRGGNEAAWSLMSGSSTAENRTKEDHQELKLSDIKAS